MEKSGIRLTAIVLAFYLCVSCSYENEVIKKPSLFVYGIEAYELIGIEHNRGLDSILMSLESHFLIEAPKRYQSVYDVFEIAEEANINFIRQYDMGEEAENFVVSHIQKVFCKEQPIRYKDPNQKLICQHVADQLSWELLKYLDRLETTVMQHEGPLQAILKELDELAWDAFVSLSDLDDQMVILSGIAVAKHTLMYWHENHLRWQTLLSRISGHHGFKSDFDWKELGVEDIAGAIGGATGARVAAFFGPIGWKAMAGVIGGAATANSVKYAIVCLLADSADDSEEHSDE